MRDGRSKTRPVDSSALAIALRFHGLPARLRQIGAEQRCEQVRVLVHAHSAAPKDGGAR